MRRCNLFILCRRGWRRLGGRPSCRFLQGLGTWMSSQIHLDYPIGLVDLFQLLLGKLLQMQIIAEAVGVPNPDQLPVGTADLLARGIRLEAENFVIAQQSIHRQPGRHRRLFR